ncbi:MAG: hypothetical protein ATN35_08455 [Epulopiscium sp. Nele67-Bin004]|nr:MAG: hypothetical protein ATN35_08455 [Epulopiscium sp. Nele67-Bin004]
MRILKITGKNEAAIQEQIKKEYGEQAVIVSSQEEKRGGILGLFKKSEWSMTIALDDPLADIDDPSSTPHKPDDEEEVDTQAFIEQLNMHREEMKASPKEVLKQSLIEEGIQAEIIDEILKDVEEDDIEHLGKVLYNTLNTFMPKFNHKLPKVNFFIGPTGVGKTTTIAKLTAMKVLQENKKVVLLTADTYRIAAVEQLKTYSEILGVNIETIYDNDDLTKYITKWQDADHIFIDTAGRSHKNLEQLAELKELLSKYEHKQVFLVLNFNTQYTDVQNIVNIYQDIADNFALIITKLDETDGIGNLLNMSYCAKRAIAFLTTGQGVPEDIEKFESLKYIKLLLGRVKYE